MLAMRRPRPAPIGVRGAAKVRRGTLDAVFHKKSDFWPFLASGVVRMGPDRRYDSFGLCFGPNRRFSTHFGPNFMFSAPTGTLASQDLGFGQPGFGQPGCGQAPLLLLADPDHEIQDFDQFLPEKLQVFCQRPFEPSTLRGVFEGDINSDCIFTRNSGCHDFAAYPRTANRPYTRLSEPLN